MSSYLLFSTYLLFLGTLQEDEEEEMIQKPLPQEKSYGNEADEQMYNTSKWRTNQFPQTNQRQQQQQQINREGTMEGMNDGDDFAGHNTTNNAYNNQYVETPDPPPPPIMAYGNNNNSEDNFAKFKPMKRNQTNQSEYNTDEEVLHDDFLNDVQPDNALINNNKTAGVNLYFLDPGKNSTKGI